jgi:hypothetical protein
MIFKSQESKNTEENINKQLAKNEETDQNQYMDN